MRFWGKVVGGDSRVRGCVSAPVSWNTLVGPRAVMPPYGQGMRQESEAKTYGPFVLCRTAHSVKRFFELVHVGIASEERDS